MRSFKQAHRLPLFTFSAFIFGCANLSHAEFKMLNCLRQQLNSKLLDPARLYSGRLTAELDAGSYAIFEKLRRDPASVLTSDEWAWINDRGLGPALSSYQKSGVLVRNLNHLLALKNRSKPVNWSSLNWEQRAWKWLSNTLSFGLPAGPQARAERIFSKFIKNPDTQLSGSDQVFLKEWHLEDELARFREELKANRQGFLVLSGVKKVGDVAYWGILGSSVAASVALQEVGQKDLSFSESNDSNRSEGLKPKGSLELLLPKDESKPPILIVGAGAFLFDIGTVTFDLMRNQPQALKELQEKSVEYHRIRLRATPKDIAALTSQLGKYVDRGQGQPHYMDMPTAEIFRILRQQLHLPPLPIVNRSSGALLSYFKLAKITEGESGPVEAIYRVGHSSGSTLRVAQDIADSALTGLVSALLVSSPIVDAALVGYDQKTSTVAPVSDQQ